MRRLRGVLRALLPFGQPQEVNVFLFIGAFALVIGVIYWFASYEAAGTVLLLGFALATGGLGIKLALDPRAEAVRERAARERARRPVVPPDVPERLDPGGRGHASEGTGGVDRPYLDERGRLPAETFAPFAVGLGVAVAVTGAVFGPAPVVVGLLPLLWGAWTWLGGARAELDATAGPAHSAPLASPAGAPDATELQHAASPDAERKQISRS